MHPNVWMPTQMLCGHTRAHAHTLMRYFLTFLHVPLENIDESPFKNNSCLVGSLSDLQFYCQHIIITFIMSDCAGACVLWREVAPPESDYRQKLDFHEKHSLSLFCTEIRNMNEWIRFTPISCVSNNITTVTIVFWSQFTGRKEKKIISIVGLSMTFRYFLHSEFKPY